MKSPIPLSSLAGLPLTFMQVKTTTVDGESAVVSIKLDEKGRLVAEAETPPEP